MYNLLEVRNWTNCPQLLKLATHKFICCVGNYDITKTELASHKIYNVWVNMIIYTNNTV